jgi:hypothetical protein
MRAPGAAHRDSRLPGAAHHHSRLICRSSAAPKLARPATEDPALASAGLHATAASAQTRCTPHTLRPVGKLKLSIKAGWLKGAAIDLDALTEASFYTQRSGEEADHCGGGTARSHFGAGEDEQDLSGFEGVAAAGHVGSTGAVGTPAAGARGGAGGATAAGRQQQPQPQGQQGAAASLPVTQQHKGSPLATISSPANSATGGSPRIAAAAVGGGARPKLPGEIAQVGAGRRPGVLGVLSRGEPSKRRSHARARSRMLMMCSTISLVCEPAER